MEKVLMAVCWLAIAGICWIVAGWVAGSLPEEAR